MTYASRLKGVGDALLNTSATPEQLDRIGRAIAAETGRLTEYDEAEDAAKSQIAITAIRAHLIGLVRRFEGGAAAEAAGVMVDEDLKEAP